MSNTTNTANTIPTDFCYRGETGRAYIARLELPVTPADLRGEYFDDAREYAYALALEYFGAENFSENSDLC